MCSLQQAYDRLQVDRRLMNVWHLSDAERTVLLTSNWHCFFHGSSTRLPVKHVGHSGARTLGHSRNLKKYPNLAIAASPSAGGTVVELYC